MQTLDASELTVCPAQGAGLSVTDELVLPMHKRTVAQYATDASGVTELRLYYGNKEISFDEPELFAFGETLAKQSRFAAGAAVTWGAGYDWDRVRGLLEQLLDEGVLRRADPADVADVQGRDGARPSPMPPAPCAAAREWRDCEAITAELTGRPLELGHLELVVPIFRVAHMALDAEGRQVGESNVFPPALRVEVPTNWRTCVYAGTRFQTERPMNVTALKAMRAHWPQMMAALRHIREAYLARCPDARRGWTVGHLERLATAVLAVPTYQLMRGDRRVENGALHPALSSMFRVTDGLRMTMHQMLFVPIGEPTLSPDAPMTAAEVLDYAERNYSFHSDHGVCAGPRMMIEEFLAVLIDGRAPRDASLVALDPGVRDALDAVDAALDYALYGLQAYAAVFSYWPLTTRTWERLHEIVTAWAPDGSPAVRDLLARLDATVGRIHTESYLATEAWRRDRDHVYADMYARCAKALGTSDTAPSLTAQIAPRRTRAHDALAARLTDIVRARFGGGEHAARMVDCLIGFFVHAQGVVRVASEVQSRINELLGRAAPTRAFGVAEIDIHNLLQGAEGRRMPHLVDELDDVLGVRLVIEPSVIRVLDASA